MPGVKIHYKTGENSKRMLKFMAARARESLIEAGNFIETIVSRQGLRVCCPEEIAFQNGWIDAEQLLRIAAPLAKSGYGDYLARVARGEGAR